MNLNKIKALKISKSSLVEVLKDSKYVELSKDCNKLRKRKYV